MAITRVAGSVGEHLAAICRALGEHFAHCEWPVAVLPTVFVPLYAAPVLDLNTARGFAYLGGVAIPTWAGGGHARGVPQYLFPGQGALLTLKLSKKGHCLLYKALHYGD